MKFFNKNLLQFVTFSFFPRIWAMTNVGDTLHFSMLLPRKIEVLIGDVIRYWQWCKGDQKEELPRRFILPKSDRLKVRGKEISCWDCAIPDLHFVIICVWRVKLFSVRLHEIPLYRRDHGTADGNALCQDWSFRIKFLFDCFAFVFFWFWEEKWAERATCRF